ncbi:ATP-binding protein [Streptomyces sp. NPDC049813]|uniref:ATP-binding response regulator n=1 Tax=Streptomyces sp. NPDC049813 TaxID=3365597 RepID=UPI003788005F
MSDEVYTTTLTEQQDVLVLRRCLQAVCRVVEVQGTALVQLVTVLSEVGQELLGAAELTARIVLQGSQDSFLIETVLTWRGPRTVGSALTAAAGRLLDRVEQTDDDEHRIVLGQRARSGGMTPQERLKRCRAAVTVVDGVDLGEVLRLQNRSLLAALEESRTQHDELARLNAELEETNAGVVAMYSELASELENTNTGVVALYAELEDKTRQLRLASEAKTRFWANVSHELRSPVNSVIALARLLLDPRSAELQPDQHQQVSMIAASGSTLLSLVDELLDVAKAESGRLDPHFAPTDLRTLFHQLRGTLSSSTAPAVELVVPDPGAHPALVTDEVMLARILRNLLANALKFTQSGHVRLDVTSERRAGHDWFLLSVQDTGVGIPDDQQERVFEEFYQVRGGHQRGKTGAGLGLPYALRLTELLGGRLTLTSTPGEGTQVLVELPAQPATPAPPATVLWDSVVIVDDDPAFLATMRPVLRELSRTQTEVRHSSQALDIVRSSRPDALLIDLMMPPPDGYDLLAALDAEPGLAGLPVAVLTWADADDVDRGRLRGRPLLAKARLSAAVLAAALAPAQGEHAPPSTLTHSPAEDTSGHD